MKSIKNFSLKITLALCIALSYASTQQGATLIFDLEGVLLEKSIIKTFWHMDLLSFLGFYNPLGLEKKFFEFLDCIEPRRPETPLAMHNDALLPQIMCDWLTGTKNNEELIAKVNQGLEKYASLFTSTQEQKIIGSLALLVFNPYVLAQVINPIKKGEKLLTQCSQKKDSYGNRLNKIYILSNWDPASFAFLQEKPAIKKLLSLTDGIIISGKAGLMKPDPAIFEYCFKTCALNPDEELTFFIDDREENIMAAQELGKKNLHALRCDNKNFKPIKKILREFEII